MTFDCGMRYVVFDNRLSKVASVVATKGEAEELVGDDPGLDYVDELDWVLSSSEPWDSALEVALGEGFLKLDKGHFKEAEMCALKGFNRIRQSNLSVPLRISLERRWADGFQQYKRRQR